VAIRRDAVIRANPHYQLKRWRSISEATPSPPSTASQDRLDQWVLLGTAGSGLPAKLVDQAGAELFTKLARPVSAPFELNSDQLLWLVLEAVVEVRCGAAWVSGPLAYEQFVQSLSAPAANDRLTHLAYNALAQAERLPTVDSDELCSRLYAFGRLPLSRRWTRLYPDPEATRTALGLGGLGRDWNSTADDRHNHWLSFARRGAVPSPHALVYKLYVSPDLKDLPPIVPIMARTLAAIDVPHFKVGAHAAGLLRPDKIVVYLSDAEHLAATAEALALALNGARPHGVPFSAELAGAGLLSWAGDPPPNTGPVGGGTESWRLSVCRRLSEYLSAAKRAPLESITPTQYALARLADDGVRLPSFTPTRLQAPC
jgi:hypothetical protein